MPVASKRQLIKAALKNLCFKLFLEEQWCVGVVPMHLLDLNRETLTLDDAHVTWITTPATYFLADPQWVDEEAGMFICECFHYRVRKGRLAIVCHKGNVVRAKYILNSFSHHYSYPQLFHVQGKCLVLPECAHDNCQKLLEIDPNTFEVLSETVIMNDIRLLDPSILYHEGLFWILGTAWMASNSELLVFHAENPSGPWVKASFSPRMIENCRGAGRPFQKDGALYWPTQYNTFTYGGGVMLNRITHLSTEAFTFERGLHIFPDPNGCYPDGLHTLNIGNNHFLIDGKRVVTSRMKLANVGVSYLRKFYSAVKRLTSKESTGPACITNEASEAKSPR